MTKAGVTLRDQFRTLTLPLIPFMGQTFRAGRLPSQFDK